MRGYLKSTNGLYQLSQKTTTVGREGCDLTIQSSAVDRQHAVIDIDDLGESYVLQDLNTTYGTYVNDCRIDNAAIRLFSGDVIRFGNSNILYEFVSSSEPTLTYPPVHRQAAWQPLTLITDREIHPGGGLPQLRSYVATTAQTFATPPAVQQPKPPTSVRSRPLSAGSRHRQVIDRASAVPQASVTGPNARQVGGWVHGGPGLLRSSSSTDLRNVQDQEERRMAWLKEEVQRLSAYERDCQNKDEVISQLYHEIDALQRRQLSHTQHHEQLNMTDRAAPRLSLLENELIAKRQEIDELKYQIQQVRVMQNNPSISELSQLRTKLEKLQLDHNAAVSQNAESKNDLAKKDEELEQLRKELDSLKQLVREKDEQLNQSRDDRARQESQLSDMQQKLNNAVTEADEHSGVINGLMQRVGQLEADLVTAAEARDQLRQELDLHRGSYQDMDSAKAELHKELNLIAGKLASFRLQVKQAICYVSDTSSATDDDDDDVIQVLKHIVSERTTFRTKVQKSKEKLSALKKHFVHLGHCSETATHLSNNGLLCRELKLEIAALKAGVRQQSEAGDFVSVFMQLLEMMSSWESDIEAALERCNIDVQNSHESPSAHIGSLLGRLVQSEVQVSQLHADLSAMRQEHSAELDILRRDLQADYDGKLSDALAANEQRQSDAVTAAVAAESAKNDTTNQLHLAKIRTLEAELDQLKQSKEITESELHSRLEDIQSTVESYRQKEVNLGQKLSTLEAERQALNSRLEHELMEVTARQTREKKLYEEQISEHARTICALEDQLDKITSKAKEYQTEISTLRATVDELTARQRQSSPQPMHRKLIMQPVQSSIDVAALGQLQRDNVDLKRQLHEQNDVIVALRRDLAGATARLSDISENDVIVALRRDLAGATARLSDISGEVSERQKVELEQKSVKIEQQHAELIELRQQLAKLSEIVDKQTTELKQLHADASKSKAAITKYKNKLNEKEAQLKQSEHGLLKVKKESSTKLSAAEDEGEIISTVKGDLDNHVQILTMTSNESTTEPRRPSDNTLAFNAENQRSNPASALNIDLFLESADSGQNKGRIQADLALAGAQCRGERHDQVITRQRDALVELRTRIRVLESGNLPVMTQDEALQELIMLRQQMSELRSASSADSLALVPFPSSMLSSHIGGSVPHEMSLPELSEAFELSENVYLSMVRALGSVLELENLTRMKSMAHVARNDRRILAAEREQELEKIIAVVRLLKERIERKDELLQGYERDLTKLRHAEDLTELTSGQKDNLMTDLRKKSEEVDCLRETLAKAKERLEQEKRLNASIKQKKTFHLENERVAQGNGWPKHHCVSDGHPSSVPGRKQNPNEKLKRKNYEIRLLQDELRSRRSDIGHHRRVTTAVDTREIGLHD